MSDIGDWLLGHLRTARNDTRAAIDAALAGIDELADEEVQTVEREGLTALLAKAVKETRLVVRQVADNAPGQLPLFVSVRGDEGARFRVSYLDLTREQHTALLAEEQALLAALIGRITVMRNDAALWEQHADAASIRDLWAAAGIEYLIVTGTDG